MKYVAILLTLCLFGCTGGIPAKNRKIAIKPLAVPSFNNEKVIIKSVAIEPKFKASAARLVVIPWQYNLPQGTLPSNYWWNIERSVNTRNWSILYSNVSVIPIIETTNKQEFFRLIGRP